MAETTSKEDHTPKRGSTAFDCPRCGAFAHQEWHDLYRVYENEDGEEWHEVATDSPKMFVVASEPVGVQPSFGYVSSEWRMAQCIRCAEYSVWRAETLMFPVGVSSVPHPHEDMPELAKVLYEEAATVVGLSRRAGTALARAALEKALKELDPQEGRVDLATRIDRVESRVSVPLFQLLSVVRHSGNKSLHVEDESDELMTLVLDPEDEQIVEIIFETVNQLAEELVAKPRRAAEMYERIPEQVRKNIGKKKQED